MAFDLIMRNVRLANGNASRGTVDIAVSNGRIAAIEARIAGNGENVDAAGRFVSPGLVESHFHLDKSRILDRVAPLPDRRATDHMARTSAVKHTFTVEDVYARARATLEQCLLNGVGHMRTHVEVDPNVGMHGYEAVERLAKDYAWGIDLQLCVFLQEGWTNVPGSEENVVAALKRGAQVVGGAPRYDTDGAGQIRRIFALAREFDVDVDIHLDGGYTTHDMAIFLVCELTDQIGLSLLTEQRMVGRVEMKEKPELLWDHPELEGLYLQLFDEYELGERSIALEQKLDLITRTAETLLRLEESRRSLRAEWYIILLIVVEILLTLYELFLRH